MANVRTIEVAAGLINQDGRYLIARRKSGVHLAGLWEFPGGKMEIGKTEQECLKRELLEELGTSVEVGNYVCSSFFLHNNDQVEMRAFFMHIFTEPFILYEHQQIKWVKKEEVLLYEFPDPDIPIIQAILNLSK